jgi:hypothetical protein
MGAIGGAKLCQRAKLRKVVFWMFLGFGQMMGAPIDPKEIEDVLHVMNRTRAEVIIEQSEPKEAGLD